MKPSYFYPLIRHISNKLTHLTADGTAKMVDVSEKSHTKRTAHAQAHIHITPEITEQIRNNLVKKGDVLTVSQLAGIMAAKQTSNLIPLCHNIHLSHVDVQARLDGDNDQVILTSEVVCVGATGVEMEALTAVTVAALTVYDMCKALSRSMTIGEVRLVRKTGGKRDFTD